MLRHRIRALYKELVKGVYTIGFINDNPMLEPSRFKFSNVRWINMNGYKHGWFADPFILDVNDDEIILLVEEFEYYNKKGRLCKIRVSRPDYKLIDVVPILTLDTHLSYPSIYKIDGDVFVCPENGEAGSVKVYKLEGNKLVNPKTIIDAPLVDTQFLELNGKFYAFGVLYDLSSQSATKILRIYESDEMFGEYIYSHSIVNNRSEERGAGNMFFDGSRIIRPAQICEGGYGRGVVLYELKFSYSSTMEYEVGRIEGDFWKRWGIGIHQIHSCGGLTVIDGRDFNNPIVGLIKRIRHKLNGIEI